MSQEEKILRAKKRIEILRKLHGLKRGEIFNALGFTRQYYHAKFVNSPKLSAKSLLGITELFSINEYDLLHTSDEEFRSLPIISAYIRYVAALKDFEGQKLGMWKSDIDIQI